MGLNHEFLACRANMLSIRQRRPAKVDQLWYKLISYLRYLSIMLSIRDTYWRNICIDLPWYLWSKINGLCLRVNILLLLVNIPIRVFLKFHSWYLKQHLPNLSRGNCLEFCDKWHGNSIISGYKLHWYDISYLFFISEPIKWSGCHAELAKLARPAQWNRILKNPDWHTQMLSYMKLLYYSLIRHPFMRCDFIAQSSLGNEHSSSVAVFFLKTLYHLDSYTFFQLI